MKFEMYTHVEFDLDRERFDESLYVIKEELEFDYHIEIGDREYERILDEVVQTEPYFDDYTSDTYIGQMYGELSSAVYHIDPTDPDQMQVDEIREAYEQFVRSIIIQTVEVMVDAGEFDNE